MASNVVKLSVVKVRPRCGRLFHLEVCYKYSTPRELQYRYDYDFDLREVKYL